MNKQGTLSINSENMFPIIKKWLYSDHDIFYREVISNACDAITKLKKLGSMGDYELPDGFKPRIDIILNDKEKTIKIVDNGIGMTADEVEQYINQLAFSGATDFLEKYKDKDANDQIIGHFGLGFYSTFMVADEVEIDTLSYKEGAEAVNWSCDGSSTYEMSKSDRADIGSTITIHLSDDCLEFCNEYRAREVIEKYCAFMPYEIYLSKENEDRTEIIKESEKSDSDVVIEEILPEEKKDDDKSGDDKKEVEEKKLKIRRRKELLNDIHPLWTRAAAECREEDYKEFYRKVFRDYREPLFWIHLNMDYPFNLKGILYFPKINLEFESAEGTIKLYNNQVFIADNIKEVIPEYLMLLKGVIDCPDLPLNVSRSALQNDGFVSRISDYISKKVAEKLSGLCKTDKENYDKYWDDISPFIKYGCLKDDKFAEKMNDFILFKNLEGKYIPLPEAVKINEEVLKEDSEEEKAESVSRSEEDTDEAKPDSDKSDTDGDEIKEAAEKVIYYVTDEELQAQYITMFKSRKLEAFIMRHNIDVPFMQQLESKNENLKFKRIDSDISDAVTSKTSKKLQKELDDKAEKLQERLRKSLKNASLNIKIQKLKDKKLSSILTVSEESRRMQDMMKMYAMNGIGMGDLAAEGQTLILNANHALVQYVMEHEDGKDSDTICAQLYDLARLQNAPLKAEEMSAFVERSNEIMLLLAK